MTCEPNLPEQGAHQHRDDRPVLRARARCRTYPMAINTTKEEKMPNTHTTTRTRAGKCPVHGDVQGEKNIPTAQFPAVVYLGRRVAAQFKPYHCPTCGAKIS